jgi:hypothetical protein
MNIDDFLIVEAFEGTRFIRKASCRFCGKTAYEASERDGEAAIERAVVGLRLHLGLCYGVAISIVKCSDQNCTKVH